MFPVTIWVSIIFIAICYLLNWLFFQRDEPHAPPRARSRVPLIGHVLGLLGAGALYYNEVSAHQHSDVYTLQIFNLKVYVVNSERLLPLIQRLSKTLSFTPFQKYAARVYVGCSKPTVDLHDNPDFMREFDKITRAALAPGPQLDYQNIRTVNSLKDCLEHLLSKSSAKTPVRVWFYDWSKHVITLASSNGVWGSSNPYLDPKLEEAFWTWNDAVSVLMAGLGSVFARKALRARQDLINAFKEYYNSGYQDAAEITKERIRVLSNYGVPADDIARMQTSFGIALFPNTTPTAFWTLFNIFSQPALLDDLRVELEERAVSRNGGNSELELDVVAIKTKCPLLLSIFQETQRTLSIAANIRKVTDDTTLETYRLRKGHYLQIPSGPIHRSTEIWGVDAAEFNPRRFVKNNSKESASSLPSYAFLPWGTAPHLCPARQFASTEIMVMAALWVLRLEIEPVGGKWKRPELKRGALSTVLPPKKDLEVEIRPRDGWNGKWSFKVGDSKSRVPLASA